MCFRGQNQEKTGKKTKKNILKKRKTNWAWWYTPITPGFGKLGQEDSCKVKDSLSYTRDPVSNKTKQDKTTRAGGVTQWYSTCLAWMRPWVQSTAAPQDSTNNGRKVLQIMCLYLDLKVLYLGNIQQLSNKKTTSFKNRRRMGTVAHACTPGTQEAEAGGSKVKASLGNLSRPYLKIKRAGECISVVKPLSNMHKPLGLSPRTASKRGF